MTHEDTLRPNEVAKLLNVTPRTLYSWEKKGKITSFRTPFNQRRYTRSSIMGIVKQTDGLERKNVCYARVSTREQKGDLDRQIEFFKLKYPDHTVVSDIGSGLNFKRKGLSEIIDWITGGLVNELVVIHKDRLCRFGVELVERLLNKTGGTLLILEHEAYSPESELVADVLSIITCFSARLHGLRSHGVKKAIDQGLEPDKREK